MTLDEFKKLQISIPDNPGIYKFIGEEGVILYVGKAKNIRKRVSNYFGNRKGKSNETGVLGIDNCLLGKGVLKVLT